jgi:hypothetical protein
MSPKLIIKAKNISYLYRGINDCKKGYQPRINIMKDENGILIADPQSVLNRWKNFFNQVLHVHGVHDVRQMDIHTADPFVPERSLVEVEIIIGKMKRYKSPGTDQIPAELIKAGGEILRSEIHKIIRSICNKEDLPQQRKESIIMPIHKRVIILNMSMKLLGIISVDSVIMALRLIRFSTFGRY